nr:porimin [Loxodonta africana]
MANLQYCTVLLPKQIGYTHSHPGYRNQTPEKNRTEGISIKRRSLLSERTNLPLRNVKDTTSSLRASLRRISRGGRGKSHHAQKRKLGPCTPVSSPPSWPRPVPAARLGVRRPLRTRLPRPIWSFGGQAGREVLCGGGDAERAPGVWRSSSRRRHLGLGPTRLPRPALGTMRLGAREAWAALLLGALQVLPLLGTAMNSTGLAESTSQNNSVVPQNSSASSPAYNPQVLSSPKNESSNSSVQLSTTPVSSVSSTLKPTVTSKASANRTSTFVKPTCNTTSISQSTSQMSTSTMTTTLNSSATSVSSSVTTTINFKENRGSKFDIGSFVGGIVLTLGVLSILYIGCKTYYSRRGIRYRTIDEHDAII